MLKLIRDNHFICLILHHQCTQKQHSGCKYYCTVVTNKDRKIRYHHYISI